MTDETTRADLRRRIERQAEELERLREKVERLQAKAKAKTNGSDRDGGDRPRLGDHL